MVSVQKREDEDEDEEEEEEEEEEEKRTKRKKALQIVKYPPIMILHILKQAYAAILSSPLQFDMTYLREKCHKEVLSTQINKP